ncbi:glycosyltransferase [Sulfurimonas sp. HSL3-7]|uniref:glycosyltransferase n=1 Tax=Sulfonitrofixus jiaomeiensis TaxID=3131938 RepID=UPI0031F76B91
MKISVIIPAYNRVATLARAIDSVLQQSYSADEIIVVDDGSSDATSEVAKMYDEVSLLRQKNMGVSSARNNGVMMASNDWIAFLDSDDTWHPEKLRQQVAYHQKNKNCKVSYTDEVWIRDEKEVAIPKKFQKPEKATFETCLSYCNIAPSSVLMQKKLFDSLGGFDESLEVCEDYDLWLRILKEEEIALVDQKLVNKYGGADDQLSMKHWGMDRFRVKALEKHLDTAFDSLVREELLHKYALLAEGARKYQKEDDVFLYEARIEQLKAGF